MLLDEDMVNSEVPQQSESHCRAPKPAAVESTRLAVVQKQQKKPNVYSLDSVYCEDWNCYIKKKEREGKKKKRHLSVPRTVWLLLCFNTQQKSPLFSNLILVACCYCRLQDLLGDSRSRRFKDPLLVPNWLLKGLFVLLTSTWRQVLIFIKHCYQPWRTVVAQNDVTWPHTCTSSCLQQVFDPGSSLLVRKKQRPNDSMSAPLDPAPSHFKVFIFLVNCSKDGWGRHLPAGCFNKQPAALGQTTKKGSD